MSRWLSLGGIRELGGRLVSARAARGFVDSVGSEVISGWVDWQGQTPPAVEVVCDGSAHPAEAEWQPRPDVRQGGKVSAENPGFRIRVPAEVHRKLSANPSLLRTLKVRVGGLVVPLSKNASINAGASAEGYRHFEPVALLARTPVSLLGMDNAVSAWVGQPFHVCLCIHLGDAPDKVRLLCNGEALDCGVIRAEGLSLLKEVAGKPTGKEVVLDFELPGLAWQASGDAGRLEIQFQAGDAAPFPARPLVITRAQAGDWISWVVAGKEPDPYGQLLALEHAHALIEHLEMAPAERANLDATAARYGLDGFITVPGDAASPADRKLPATTGDQEPRKKSDAFWKAVRTFNERLPGMAGREDALLAEICLGLPREERSEYIEHVAPYFFRIDRFDVIKPHVPLARAAELAGWADTYTVSMSLPFFVAHGELARACEIVYSISQKKGWLSTDAVAAASVLVARDLHAFPEHEKFAYAIISLIDGLSSDYWSRHQDVQLGRALAVWLERPSWLSSWMLRDLEAAVIRNYGLSPEFWARHEFLCGGDEPSYSGFRVAHSQFLVLRKFVDAWQPNEPVPAKVPNAIAYFRRVGNIDLPRTLRELVCSRLVSAGDTAASSVGMPLQDLLALDDAEAVRVAALPVADDAVLTPELPLLRPLLNAMQPAISRAGHYALQCRLGRALRQLETCDAQAFAAALPGLLAENDVLATAGNNFLAVDVLARLLLQADGRNDANIPLLAVELSRQLTEGLRSGAAWPYQPLLSALASLRYVAGKRQDLYKYVQRLAGEISTNYSGSRHASIEQVLTLPAHPLMRAPAGRDTLVVVYSCRKYIDSRVKAMRESWLKDLQAHGIPFIVLVGDGNDSLDGDLLSLNVSDRYEDLPAKTLAMIRWVSTHTDFQYLLKIDDDCLLSADEYFDSLSYRKFHYYGRLIQRAIGGTDRKWHQQKSQGDRARLALDKSPEPSVYADGGGGYLLSRLAMQRLLAQSETAWGQRLISCSYMEDKLVGDLLSAEGIRVSNEDYCTLIRRRFGSDLVPVAIWDNSFAPSTIVPTKMAHLDAAADMAVFHAGMRGARLLPRKIWPGHARASIWYNENQLELLSSAESVRRLTGADISVVAVMRNEMTMLPHFLAHYRRQGIQAFVIVDNVSDDGTRQYLLAQPDVILYSADSEYSMSTYGVSWQQTVLAHHCLGRWALVADADEFLLYPDCETKPLRDYVAALSAAGHDAVRIDMVDMYPFGDLADADFRKDDPFVVSGWFDNPPLEQRLLGNGFYGNAPNHVSALRHRQMPFAEPDDFTAQKYCLVRYAPWMRFPAGLHNVVNARVAPESLAFAHFKYHAGFKAKVEEEVARKQHFGGAKEYRKYLAMLAESKGGFGRDGVSARYSGSAAFLSAARRVAG